MPRCKVQAGRVARIATRLLLSLDARDRRTGDARMHGGFCLTAVIETGGPDADSRGPSGGFRVPPFWPRPRSRRPTWSRLGRAARSTWVHRQNAGAHSIRCRNPAPPPPRRRRPGRRSAQRGPSSRCPPCRLSGPGSRAVTTQRPARRQRPGCSPGERLAGPGQFASDEQIDLFGAARTTMSVGRVGAQLGGYLESSLCMPHLTRTSAAWTCS